jgi:hypothetical protein
VKHEFRDLFGVEGMIFLKEIELAESQRIALDVLLRQLESVDKEVEFVQKRIAIVAKGDEVVIILMTIPSIDYYSAMIIRKFYLRLKKQKGTKIAVMATARKLLRVIYCMLCRKENYRYERKALTESKLKRLEKTAC